MSVVVSVTMIAMMVVMAMSMIMSAVMGLIHRGTINPAVAVTLSRDLQEGFAGVFCKRKAG